MRRRGTQTWARARRVLLALLLAVSVPGLGQAVAPSPARAALPDLTLVTATTYDVLPDEGRVAATVRITATNRRRDTATRRFYFVEGYLAVLPGASNFRLRAPAGSPSVTVSSRTASGVLLRLRFGSQLGAGKSIGLTLTFDLVDPGGSPDRVVRISPSLVSFQAWASASAATPGSSVEVRIPAGYNVVLGRGPLAGPTTDAAGRQVFTSGPLKAPLAFVADISADRAGGYVEGRRSATVGEGTAIVTFRAWPDDPGWRDRVSDVVLRSLPVLGEAIGAPWPFGEPLTITETLVRDPGGAVGILDPGTARLGLAYLAQPAVILHEMAHGWFNGRLVADRWIAEGFATYYANRAAAALAITTEPPQPAEVPETAPFPLNAWSPTGTGTEQGDAGAAAAFALAAKIAALVGDDALRATWRAAAAGEPAYRQPEPARGVATETGRSAAAETGAPPPDWRALLDLLEENADPGDAAALEELWRRWVTRPADAALLDARTAAREKYAATVGAAAPWALPRSVRDALRAWQFDAANQLMDDATALLRQRAAVGEAAAAVGLAPPGALRVAFEGGDGFAAAAAEAAAELAAIGQIRAAEAARIGAPGLIDRLGLLGTDPDTGLRAARAAFQAGDQDAALAGSSEALAAWRSVPEVARGRLLSSALLGLAVLLLAWLIWQRRHLSRAPGW